MSSVSIESVNIAGVKTLGVSTFANCTSLIEVYFSNNNLLNINAFAFKGCTSLTSITLPSSLKKIRTGAFDNTGIKSVVIPASVTRVGRLAFGKGIEEITFEDRTGWNLVVENSNGSAYKEIIENIDVTNATSNAASTKLLPDKNNDGIPDWNSVDEYPCYYYFEKVLDMPLES